MKSQTILKYFSIKLGLAKQTKKSLVMSDIIKAIEKWIVPDTSRGNISWEYQHFGSSLTVFIKTENVCIQ